MRQLRAQGGASMKQDKLLASQEHGQSHWVLKSREQGRDGGMGWDEGTEQIDRDPGGHGLPVAQGFSGLLSKSFNSQPASFSF